MEGTEKSRCPVHPLQQNPITGHKKKGEKEMKKLFACVLSFSLFLLGSVDSRASGPTKEDPLTLTFTSMYMPTHAIIKDGIVPFAEELKEKSGGRLLLEIFNPSTLCPDTENYDCVKNGVVDMAVAVPSATPGKFPIAAVSEMPFLFDSCEESTYATYKAYTEIPEIADEFNETKMLAVFGSAPLQVHTAKKEIKTLDDVKGLRLACVSTAVQPIFSKLGAAVFAMPGTDLYLALQRGQIDGACIPNAFMTSTKTYEVAKKTCRMNFMTCSQILVINKDVFNSLPADLQQVLLDLTGEAFSMKVGKAIDVSADEDMKTMKQHGQVESSMAEAEILKAREATASLVDEWKEKAAAAGAGDPDAIYRKLVGYAEGYVN